MNPALASPGPFSHLYKCENGRALPALILAAFCAVGVLAEVPEFEAIAPNGVVVDLRWTNTSARVVLQGTTFSGESFSFASPVLSDAQSWSVSPSTRVQCFRLLKVEPLFADNPALETPVRSTLIADGVKLDPDTFVYDVEMPLLTGLVAVASAIDRIDGLEYAVSLETLFLADNIVSNLTPLSGLSALRVLDIGQNQVESLASLAGLAQLHTLYADGNACTNLDGLASLSNLETLLIPGNALDNIDALSGLTRLAWVSLANNALTDLSPLEDALALTVLDLSNNPGISTLAPLLSNAAAGGLGAGDTVYILSNHSIPEADILALEAYGVEVIGP